MISISREYFIFRLAKLNIRMTRTAVARLLRGLDTFALRILGLTPQALCCRPLRGLGDYIVTFQRFLAGIFWETALKRLTRLHCVT